MKLLTVTIPCYNSQEYMEHAIQTALTGGEAIEILIVEMVLLIIHCQLQKSTKKSILPLFVQFTRKVVDMVLL